MRTIDGIDLDSFSSGESVKSLGMTRWGDDPFGDVPTVSGVYVVVREAASAPTFLRDSRAGQFKGLDPSYPEAIVKAAWVPNATVVYIGKGAGRNGLRQRVGQLVNFAYGANIGHRGGRLLWHLSDWEDLLVRWMDCPGASAAAIKADLIKRFQREHGDRLPYANRSQ
ncbi:hypothetical protein [Ralstonia pseudosolanacearum]|uniref:hypothetical protein n=1 Tax=Ralstonia pseudosolanacearum TaxID=1310165 RepID=UPI001FF93AAB|nr:hypothetical protein [Ralstonia pseudosolanacearum]